jgi:WD40 repeat protein
VYAEARQKRISVVEISIDTHAHVVVSPSSFAVQTYRSSIQGLSTSPDGKLIMALTDRQLLRIFGIDGTTLLEHNFAPKFCSELLVKNDFSQAFLVSGTSVEIFSLTIGTTIEIKSDHVLNVASPIQSITFAEKRKQLIVASTDGLITLFKPDVKAGIALRFNSSHVRIVRASPASDHLAIISQKAKLQLVSMETGALYSELEKVHNGDVHYLQWSVNGNWIFVASKTEPNIETFSLAPDSPE